MFSYFSLRPVKESDLPDLSDLSPLLLQPLFTQSLRRNTALLCNPLLQELHFVDLFKSFFIFPFSFSPKFSAKLTSVCALTNFGKVQA